MPIGIARFLEQVCLRARFGFDSNPLIPPISSVLSFESPHAKLSRMAILIAAVAGLLFGGADQYLGSLIELGPWTYSVSAMSAPWLVLPFGAGSTQRRAGRAALLGIVVRSVAHSPSPA